MTMVVGVNLGCYVILAAESRSIWWESGKPERIDDRTSKVFVTGCGLASGSGIIQAVFGLISAVKDRPEVVGDPSELSLFMQGFMGPSGFLSTAKIDDPRAIPAAQRTGWLFTSVETQRVHVRLYHSDHNFVPRELPGSAPLVLLPIDVTPQQSMPHEMRLCRSLRPAKTAREIDGTLDRNLSVLAEFFRAIRAMSSALGPASQVGYQTTNGEVELTDLMDLDDLAPK